MLTYELARRLEDSGIDVNAVHPGFVATRWGQNDNGLVGAAIGLGQKLFGRTSRTGRRFSGLPGHVARGPGRLRPVLLRPQGGAFVSVFARSGGERRALADLRADERSGGVASDHGHRHGHLRSGRRHHRHRSRCGTPCVTTSRWLTEADGPGTTSRRSWGRTRCSGPPTCARSAASTCPMTRSTPGSSRGCASGMRAICRLSQGRERRSPAWPRRIAWGWLPLLPGSSSSTPWSWPVFANVSPRWCRLTRWRGANLSPDVYREACARLGASPRRSAAVEDSSSGIQSAAGAGLAVIAIPNPAFPPSTAVTRSGRRGARFHRGAHERRRGVSQAGGRS